MDCVEEKELGSQLGLHGLEDLHERATGQIFATVTCFEPPGFTWHRRHDPQTLFFVGQNEETLGNVHMHDRATGPIFAIFMRFEPLGFTWHRRHDPQTLFFVGQNEETLRNVHLHDRATGPIFAT